MSHIKDRLIQLKNEVENTGNGAYFSKNNISKIVELLLADLEQDEKENGWIPVSERLPEIKMAYIKCFWLQMEDFAGWHIGHLKKNGFLRIAQIVKIKLIGQTLWHGCRFRNHIRRTK